MYVVFVGAAQFEHHDLSCHLKTPQHCTSCASSSLSVNPHTPSTLDTVRFADAGRAVVLHVLFDGTLLPVSSSGRSPPAFS
jgi:hypothetical protein